MMNQIDKFIVAGILLVLAGCGGGVSVHTMGDTIDFSTFKGIVEINVDAIDGEINHDSMLRLKVEENIAIALRDKYKNMGSYSVFLITASLKELRTSNHRALSNRGYTHLLIAAINPEKNTGTRSMAVSCTIYRLSDGMPISLVNTDVYAIAADYWGRKSTEGSGVISERWQLGSIYSCDEALKAVAG